MQVIASRAAGAADTADDVAALHLRAGLDLGLEEVAVAGLQAEAVVDGDEITVAVLPARLPHGAGGGGVDRLTLLAGDVQARMKVGFAGYRVLSRPHGRGEPAARRPDG